MAEAMKRFFAGQLPSLCVGDAPKASAITQTDNRAQEDNFVGHDANAQAPPAVSLPELVEHPHDLNVSSNDL